MKKYKYFLGYFLFIILFISSPIPPDVILFVSIILLTLTTLWIDSFKNKSLFEKMFFVLVGFSLLSGAILGNLFTYPESTMILLFAINSPIFYVLFSMEYILKHKIKKKEVV